MKQVAFKRGIFYDAEELQGLNYNPRETYRVFAETQDDGELLYMLEDRSRFLPAKYFVIVQDVPNAYIGYSVERPSHGNVHGVIINVPIVKTQLSKNIVCDVIEELGDHFFRIVDFRGETYYILVRDASTRAKHGAALGFANTLPEIGYTFLYEHYYFENLALNRVEKRSGSVIDWFMVGSHFYYILDEDGLEIYVQIYF